MGVKLSPFTWIFLAGITVVAFICGRISVSQSDGANDHEVSDFIAASKDSVASGSSIKSTAHLRDKIKNLPRMFPSLRRGREWFHLQDQLVRLEVSNIVALIQEYSQEELTPNDLQGVKILFEAMAKKAPEAAWELAATLQPPMRNPAMIAAVAGLAEKFPEAALEKIDAIDDDSLHRSLTKSLLSAIAETDPSRAFDILIDDPVQLKDANLIREIFSQWTSTDMNAAQAALAKLSGDSRMAALGAITSTLAETDPADAWKFALANGTLPNARQSYFGGPSLHEEILRQWANIDPEAALQAAAAVEGRVRDRFLESTLRAWAGNDYEKVFQFVMDSSDSNILCTGIRALTGSPQECDYAALFNAFTERGSVNESLYRNTMVQLMHRWFEANPREAATAVAKLPPGNDFRTAVSDISSQWARKATDINEPLKWALSLPTGETRSNALSTIFSQWGMSNNSNTRDHATAAAAVLALPEADRNDNLLCNVASQWAMADPQAALDWASRLPDPEQRQNVVQESIIRLAFNNPQQAIALLNTYGLATNATAVGQTVDLWTLKDIRGASEWVKTLPNGEVRDGALQTIAERYKTNDAPETAVAWALAIANPTQRVSAIESIVWQWKRHDPKSAEAWVTSSNLPEASKNKLLGK